MSDFAAVPIFDEPTRRRVSARQAETVHRLTAASVDEVRSVGYDALTVRSVAKRAGVAPATAYTYFASKQHLLTEVFWRRLMTLPPTEHAEGASVAQRATAALSDLALLVADDPAIAAACTTAMFASDPDVNVLRERIGAEMLSRLSEALEGHEDPAVLRAVQLALQGALVQAGLGHLDYNDLPDRLAEVVGLLLPEGE